MTASRPAARRGDTRRQNRSSHHRPSKTAGIRRSCSPQRGPGARCGVTISQRRREQEGPGSWSDSDTWHRLPSPGASKADTRQDLPLELDAYLRHRRAWIVRAELRTLLRRPLTGAPSAQDSAFDSWELVVELGAWSAPHGCTPFVQKGREEGTSWWGRWAAAEGRRWIRRSLAYWRASQAR
jgi:hypothetical protein